MNRLPALIFATITAFFLICTAGAISFRKPELVLLFALLAVANTGFGFAYKKHLNRKTKR